MATVIPITRATDTGTDLFDQPSLEDKIIATLERYYPQLCNDIAMLIGKPFRLNWDWENPTASTDCQATINLSPWFFLDGHVEVGFGSAYHECGHINHSPYGMELLRSVHREGDMTLEHIIQIVLDRKDDKRTAADAPGFADTLRRRLEHICTMGRRQELEAIGTLSSERIERILASIRPRNPYEDFFFAAKWHRRARFKVTHKALKFLTKRRLQHDSPAKLLWIAKKIRAILGDMPGIDQAEAEREFNIQVLLLLRAGYGARGRKLPPKLLAAIVSLMKRYASSIRAAGRRALIERLKAAPMMHPGPLSTGTVATVPVIEVPSAPQWAAPYQDLYRSIQSWVDPLTRKLRRLDNPSVHILHGQEEGELDFGEVARIATGLGGYREKEVTLRNIDAEIHLAIDCSGSMSGDKVEAAKKIATAFSEAIFTMHPNIIARVWGYNSTAIYDFGPPSRSSGFVTLEGGASNSDSHMLAVAGKALAKSSQRRRLLLMLCDDGPDDIKKVQELSHQFLARGIMVVHLLVGVHGTPRIFPFELVYTSMDECLEEFGDLLTDIIKHLK